MSLLECVPHVSWANPFSGAGPNRPQRAVITLSGYANLNLQTL